MNASDIESQLNKANKAETAAMAEAFTRAREGVADQIVRHRNEEAADFADAQHQIVGYETLGRSSANLVCAGLATKRAAESQAFNALTK